MKSRVTRAVLLAVALLTLAIAGGAAVVAETPAANKATAAAGAKLKLGLSPNTVQVRPGVTAWFTVNITRTKFSGPVSFTVTGLPAHASASFTPAQPTGTSTTMKIATAATTPVGPHAFTLHASAGSISADITAHVIVKAPSLPAPFEISGNLDRLLSPGRTGYLNLALTNPGNKALKVTTIVVTISSTNRSGCSAAGNFTVTQYAGHYPLAVPAHSTRTLTQFRIPQNNMPRVTMNDLSINQDSCKNTSLTLSYTGSGYGQ
jgi:hypothetical protein